MILVRNLLLSTSTLNRFRHCNDKKKRSRIIGSFVGQAVLYLLLMAFCITECVGYGYYGFTYALPILCASLISVLSFILTFFMTNGYLFNFKDYDMLMALPLPAKDVASCRFLYMYLKSLPWYMCASLSMLIGYGIYAKPSAAVYPIWIILSMILPVIPMLFAAFLGFLIAKLSSGFRNKNIAMAFFSVLLAFSCFGLRFFLDDMFRNQKTAEVLTELSDAVSSAGSIYLPIKWFSNAITDLRISDMLLFVSCSILLFILIFIPVGKSYRKINSALQSHASAGKFVMKEQKSKGLLNTIAFKEFKRMTGSSIYMSNACIGELFCLAAGIAVLFVDIDKLLIDMFQQAPITKEMLLPAIPLIVYLFIGIVSTTTFTPSLEGKNYWIVQSLPLSKKTLYQGKMLFNMYLTVPFAVFAAVMICISAKAPVLCSVLSVILVICLCAFSTAWGCLCGIKHINLEWTNEVEVIKQGMATAVYIFPNLFGTITLLSLTVFLGTFIDRYLILTALLILFALLTALCYRKVMALSKD